MFINVSIEYSRVNDDDSVVKKNGERDGNLVPPCCGYKPIKKLDDTEDNQVFRA